MISEQLLLKIETLAQQVAEREGVEIYNVEFAGGAQGRTLRIYIDKAEGIGVDECANVSRGLNLLLDVEDPIPGGAYNLEVSSPGLDRVLKKPWHFERVIGKKVWLKTGKSLEALGLKNNKIKSAKQITEVLHAADSQGVKFQIEDEELFIPFTEIEKAKLVFEFNEGKNNKKR